MLIAVAVLAAAVVGVVAWWLRRSPVSGDVSAGFEAERKWDWEFLLAAEAEAAFLEGLRAYHDSGNPVRVGWETGVLTTYEPPRLISLSLFADAFAARGDAAMHDPQGTVAALMEQLAGVERPGVLHLRPGWLEQEVDGMDAAAFLAAAGETVHAGTWSGEAGIGALQVSVLGSGEPAQAGLSHVNGTPLKNVGTDVTVGVAPAAPPEPTPGEADGPALTPDSQALVPDGPLPVSDGPAAVPAVGQLVGETAGPATGESAGQMAGQAAGETGQSASQTAGESAGQSAGRTAGRAVGETAGGSLGEANTMMLDLARVLDLYREAREKQPDAEAQALLREVLPSLIASGGPGLTWTRPPTPAELRVVLGNSP